MGRKTALKTRSENSSSTRQKNGSGSYQEMKWVQLAFIGLLLGTSTQAWYLTFKGHYLSEHSQHLKGKYGYNQFADEGTAAERSLNKLLKATQLITDKTEVPPHPRLLIVCSFYTPPQLPRSRSYGQSGPQWESIRWKLSALTWLLWINGTMDDGG